MEVSLYFGIQVPQEAPLLGPSVNKATSGRGEPGKQKPLQKQGYKAKCLPDQLLMPQNGLKTNQICSEKVQGCFMLVQDHEFVNASPLKCFGDPSENFSIYYVGDKYVKRCPNLSAGLTTIV